MIKSVKNEFFIYCKETRIESSRSFYGSFSLGPFDSGQSITIANALRRTLLSELKGLAITSAEIEGAFHEYSTLPGVRDSILDILLNLKDIVLKTENYGNKKRGTSYGTTFKKTQIGYLKTRGPGIVTASELKLPPGIQCVDPDQYIATLSEEGILNIKLMINEGKNYVLQNSYSSNQNSNPFNFNSDKSVAGKKESFLAKELIGQNLTSYKKVSSKKVVMNRKNNQVLPDVGLINPGYKPSPTGRVGASDFLTYINFKRRRLWLHKRNLFKSPSLFLRNSAITKNFPNKKGVQSPNNNIGFKPFLLIPQKEAFCSKQKVVKPGLLLPVLTMVKKIRSIRKTSQLATHIDLLSHKEVALKFKKKDNLFSFLLVKRATLRGGVKGFFENTRKDNLQVPAKGSNYVTLNSTEELFLREGGAITATKAVSLVIDAVFMPVNKVNYIVETNEQSVISSERTSSNLNSIASFDYGISKSTPLPIFNSFHNQTVKKTKNDIKSQQLRFLKSCVGKQNFLPFNKESTSFRTIKETGPLLEFKRAKVLVAPQQIARIFRQVPYPLNNERRKKVFLKSAAAQKTKIIVNQFNKSTNANILDFSLPQYLPQDRGDAILQDFPQGGLLRKEKGFFKNKMRLKDNQTKTPLKNNIILEIWTNGSIHPRQALYEACKNLLSLFSKLEKATPLAFPQKTSNIL